MAFNVGGLKGILATSFAAVGLWGITYHLIDILPVYVVWLIVGLVLAVV